MADEPKVAYEQIPPHALHEIAKVFTFGEAKYGPGVANYKGGVGFDKMFGALHRHVWAWRRGEIMDPESGLPHLAHAAANLMMMLEIQHRESSTKKYTAPIEYRDPTTGNLIWIQND